MTGVQLLTGAEVLPRYGAFARADVLLEGDTIRGVEPFIEPPEGCTITDLTGLTLVPGFIDLHVHGGGGRSLISTNPEELAAYAAFAAAHGVTSYLPTIVGDSLEHGIACLRTLSAARAEGAQWLGVNLEGPFVSHQRPGALPKSWIQPPDSGILVRLLDAAGGALRIMTIAPELPDARHLIREIAAYGIVASLGHTDATHEDARAGFEAGARHVTHAFNAMRPLHHREPGPLGAALELPHVTLEVIADGIHLHPATVRLLVEAFGPDRLCLITDAVSPAGLNSGTFRIGEQKAGLEEGAVRLPDGTLAGSALTMDQAIRNMTEWGFADLACAIRMASANPASVVGEQNRRGAIAPGYRADIVVLTNHLQVSKTWVGGRLVYDAGAT